MDDNDFDFESDYDPQEEPGDNPTPPFESGAFGDSGFGTESDVIGAELDSSESGDMGNLVMHEIDSNAMAEASAPKRRKKPKSPKKERSWQFYASISLVLGVVLGIFYGYVINPVTWVDARIYHLQIDLQEDYVRAVIDSYELTDNKEQALRRLNELGLDRSSEFLALIAANPGSQDIGKIQQLSALVSSDFGGGQVPDGGDGGTGAPAGEDGSPSEAGGIPSLYLVCIVIALGLVLVAIVLYLRKRATGKLPSEEYSSFEDAQEYSNEAPQTNYAMGSESQPISQWMTTYLIGDDLFDDSFSIDTPDGEFMGECGIGIADTIGVGEPKRVDAFEIWLFDKNDIQTVTKVLMSEHVFSDEAISRKLSAKGDPEMALTGHEVVMETATLQMVARVVDMTYGAGSLPDNSFFERMTIELAVWQK
ncbi:MAG: hypothetical protein N2C13_06250 [Chloroflexota bacterium]